MPDRRRACCRNCGAHRDDVGPLSWTGLCELCGLVRLNENALSISEKQGAPYLHQQRRQFMKAYAALLDAERESA